MTQLELSDQIAELMASTSGGVVTVDQIKAAGDQIDRLGLDSLAVIRFLIKCEETWHRELEIEKVIIDGHLITMSQLVAYLESIG